jgi:hypothetical protein
MQPVRDSAGNHVGWLHGFLLFDPEFENLGHVQSGYVFDTSGNHVANFLEEYFWNLDGEAVAFVPNATGTPTLPPFVPVFPSEEALTDTYSLPQLPPLPQVQMTKLYVWSSESWAELFSAVRA